MGLSRFLHRWRHAGRLRRIALGRTGRDDERLTCDRCAAEERLLRRIETEVREEAHQPLPDEPAFLAAVRTRIAAAGTGRTGRVAVAMTGLRPALAGIGFALGLVVLSVGVHRIAPPRTTVTPAIAESMLVDLDAGVDVPADLDLDAILSDPELAADLRAA